MQEHREAMRRRRQRASRPRSQDGQNLGERRSRWDVLLIAYACLLVASGASAGTATSQSTPATVAGALQAYQERWWPVMAYAVARMDDIAAELRRAGTSITVEQGTHPALAAAPNDSVSRYIRTFGFGPETTVKAEIQPALFVHDRITGWPSLRVWARLDRDGRGLFMLVLHTGTGGDPGRATLHLENDLQSIPESQSDTADFRGDAKFRAVLDTAIRAAYQRAVEDAARQASAASGR